VAVAVAATEAEQPEPRAPTTPSQELVCGPPTRRPHRRGQEREIEVGRIDEGDGGGSSYRAIWRSPDSRVVMLMWDYADCLAFLLVRNSICYAGIFERGQDLDAATLQRIT
jgi:hypothetical protein